MMNKRLTGSGWRSFRFGAGWAAWPWGARSATGTKTCKPAKREEFLVGKLVGCWKTKLNFFRKMQNLDVWEKCKIWRFEFKFEKWKIWDFPKLKIRVRFWNVYCAGSKFSTEFSPKQQKCFLTGRGGRDACTGWRRRRRGRRQILAAR